MQKELIRNVSLRFYAKIKFVYVLRCIPGVPKNVPNLNALF